MDVRLALTQPSVMDADFCGNLASGEPMSHGGQILSKAEAELSGDNEALWPVRGLDA